MKRHAPTANGFTWCGIAMDDVLWTTEASEVTCKTCAAILKAESAKAKQC